MKTTAFKMTELGPIPSDWEVKRLGDCGTFIGGSVFPLSCQGEKSGDYPFFKVSDFSNAGNEYSLRHSNNYISKSMAQSLRCQIIPNQSIVFAKIGAAIALERKRMVCQDSCIDNNMMAFYVNDKVDVHYCLELLKKLKFADFSESTALPALNIRRLRDCAIPLPPLPEQHRIAAALSDMDELIGALGKLVEKKRAIKTGAMQRLLTGQTRLPGFGGKEFKQTELGPIPSDWEVKRLGNVCDICTGKRNGDEQVENGLYPFFVRSSVVYRINTYSYEGEAILVPGEGGIGEIFHYINGRFDYHQRVYKLSDFSKEVFARFVYYYLRRYFGDWAKAQTVKATVDSLRLPTFEQFRLILPSLPEQRAIAAVLSDMDAEIAALEAEKRKVEAIKQGMMQELLTGRVRLFGSEKKGLE